jgi:hypothetical protein
MKYVLWACTCAGRYVKGGRGMEGGGPWAMMRFSSLEFFGSLVYVLYARLSVHGPGSRCNSRV